MRQRSIVLLLSLSFWSCGDCADHGGPFFEPESFGTYEFEPAPDITVPPVLDFGEVEIGARRTRELEVGNIGRLDLRIFSIDVSDPGFTARAELWADEPFISPRTTRVMDVEYRAQTGSAVHERLTIASNDPDEPEVAVALIANRTTPCIGTFADGQPRWQVHDGEGPQCWPSVSSGHGIEAEYEFADVPGASEAGWTAEPDNHISFERESSLCGTSCECRGGGDFTYFQTFMFVPETARVGRYIVEIDNVDDGARVTVYNSRYPDGVTDPDSYARIPGGSSADLAPYLVTGQNRIVITHVDDCCRISRIRDVRVTVDGEELSSCDD